MHAYVSLRRGLYGFQPLGTYRKISPCVDLRSRRKNYNVRLQVFKTMQGAYGWIAPFDIVLVAYCCGIFVPASYASDIICNLLSDRG